MDGFTLGLRVEVGPVVGTDVGANDGLTEGFLLGVTVGTDDGREGEEVTVLPTGEEVGVGYEIGVDVGTALA